MTTGLRGSTSPNYTTATVLLGRYSQVHLLNPWGVTVCDRLTDGRKVCEVTPAQILVYKHFPLREVLSRRCVVNAATARPYRGRHRPETVTGSCRIPWRDRMTGWGGRHYDDVAVGTSAQQSPDCARQQRSVHTAWTATSDLPGWAVDTTELHLSLLGLLEAEGALV